MRQRHPVIRTTLLDLKRIHEVTRTARTLLFVLFLPLNITLRKLFVLRVLGWLILGARIESGINVLGQTDPLI